MKDLLNDETFLARWLTNELTEEELNQFQQHPDFPYFQQLAVQSNQMAIPALEEEALLKKIKAKRKKQLQKVAKQNRFPRRLFLASAATIALLIVAYFAFFNQKRLSFETAYGEQLAHTLPDGSTILLNAKSTFHYKQKDFHTNRTIQLNGEAFFEVQKGSPFIIKTKNGTIEVLGTSFLVNSKKEKLLVNCKSGRVRVSSPSAQLTVLNAGERVKIIDGILQSKESTDGQVLALWKTGMSRFDSENLGIVAEAIEDQFGITIQLSEALAKEKFTGGFLHQDIDTALKMVFVAMGLEYEKVGENVWKIVKE